ncbi:MAG: primosomal protein N' [Lachnospiraceae bacterium]|nr:primosomal protein N' [Lachnospiraceae bacterium]
MRQQYADIIVDITQEKLDRTFQYKVPQKLVGKLEEGTVVEVPFGNGSRIIKGYVISLSEEPKIDPGRLKEIHGISIKEVGAQENIIALAAWIRKQYGGTMIQAIKTVIPVKQKQRSKEKRTICLSISKEEAEEKLGIFQKKHQTARARLLEALMEEEELPYELVTGKLNVTSQVIKALEEQQIIQCSSVTVYRNPIHVEGKKEYTIRLNEEQEAIVRDILLHWDDENDRTSLIHGITGSGKTEIYMELIAHAIAMGGQAIVLIPEIALTYQTVMRFYRRFGERISIMHSRLSPGERYDQFERAKKGEIDVMIGPRSALFTPFPNLKMIIIDEEHEDTYQSETVPRYHARETAIRRAQMENAKVVLGSATPSLEAYYRAQNGEYRLYTLKRRAKESRLPDVEIVDLREELRSGNRSVLSVALREKIEDRLEKKQQVMLFLNRRGYAGFLCCRSCGHVIKCPHCDVSLAIHNNGKLVCHYCGYEQEQPKLCPTCGSPFLSGFRVGTQQIEEVVQREFPKARILRMDLDTTREKDGHARILSSFADHEADILIGTQMIVKGHDFPNVTLMGVIAADLSLHAGTYRAAEKTFQLLTQAAGRAGRGEQKGEVIIQTYDPEHYSIVNAARQDYESFYDQEMMYRMMAGYPPCAHLMEIHASCADKDQLDMGMNYLKQYLQQIIPKKAMVSVIGPADEQIAKINDMYRKVMYIKYKEQQMLLKIKERVEQYIRANEGYRTILIQFDMN